MIGETITLQRPIELAAFNLQAGDEFRVRPLGTDCNGERMFDLFALNDNQFKRRLVSAASESYLTGTPHAEPRIESVSRFAFTTTGGGFHSGESDHRRRAASEHAGDDSSPAVAIRNEAAERTGDSSRVVAAGEVERGQSASLQVDSRGELGHSDGLPRDGAATHTSRISRTDNLVRHEHAGHSETDKIVRPTDEKPPAHINGIVLVVDLMNILVRCWHVGQPSTIHAVRGMLDSVRLVALQYHPSLILFAHEGGHGHRHAIYPEYKTTRPETEQGLKDQIALCLKALDLIGWPVLPSTGFEADDVLATLATDLATRADEVVLVTSDKDLLGFVGRDGVTVHDPAKKVRVTREHVRERLGIDPHQVSDFLTLQGDTSDNIPGGAGIGAKTAAELLTVCGDLKSILKLAANTPAGHPQAKALAKVQRSRADIELSQQLVTLVTDTPLPSRWWLWPADQPRAYWQQRLQELGLGEPARRLAECGLFNETRSRHVPLLPPIRTESSHVENRGSGVLPISGTGDRDASAGMPDATANQISRPDSEQVRPATDPLPVLTDRPELTTATDVPDPTGETAHAQIHRDAGHCDRITTGTQENRPPSEAGSTALDDTQPTGRKRREPDRLSLPAWLCDAATFVPLYAEDISLTALQRKHQEGIEWRASSPNIVAGINTNDPVTYCRKIWDETPTASQLAFCRGALGQPFEDVLIATAMPSKASTEPTRRVSTPSLF